MRDSGWETKVALSPFPCFLLENGTFTFSMFESKLNYS